MKSSNIQSTGGNQTYANEMKRKQLYLGTESYLRASNRSGDKREISIYSIQLTTAVSIEVYKFFDPKIYPFAAILSPTCKQSRKFVGSAEACQKYELTKSAAIEDKDYRNQSADDFNNRNFEIISSITKIYKNFDIDKVHPKCK